MAGFVTARANAILDSELGTSYLGLVLLGTGATVTFTNATNLVNEAAHGRSNGDVLILKNVGGALPAELSESVEYFIVNANAGDYQLAATLGGAAIAITDDGTGTNTVHNGLDDAATGQSEVSAGNYARQLIGYSAAALRRKENNTAEIFPDGGSNGFTVATGEVAWFVIYDAVTAGNPLMYGLLDSYQDLQINDKYEVAIGNLDTIINTTPVTV